MPAESQYLHRKRAQLHGEVDCGRKRLANAGVLRLHEMVGLRLAASIRDRYPFILQGLDRPEPLNAGCLER